MKQNERASLYRYINTKLKERKMVTYSALTIDEMKYIIDLIEKEMSSETDE